MTNEEQNSQNGQNGQNGQNEPTETSDNTATPEQTDAEIVREAIEAASEHPHVSGIGTERGFLETLLEYCDTVVVLSEDQLGHARLVKARADEVTNNYLS